MATERVKCAEALGVESASRSVVGRSVVEFNDQKVERKVLRIPASLWWGPERILAHFFSLTMRCNDRTNLSTILRVYVLIAPSTSTPHKTRIAVLQRKEERTNHITLRHVRLVASTWLTPTRALDRITTAVVSILFCNQSSPFSSLAINTEPTS